MDKVTQHHSMKSTVKKTKVAYVSCSAKPR